MDKINQEQWPVIKRESKFIRPPWGYKRDLEDPYTLHPIEGQIVVLEEAFRYLDDGGTLREVSGWMLSKLPDNPLSHQGLSQLWKKHRVGDKDNERVKKLKAQKKKLKPKTEEEATRKELTLKRAAAKRAITRQSKKLEKIIEAENDLNGTRPEAQSSSVITELEELDTEQEVVFRPNPGPQTEFLMASEKEVLYGGAAGGEPMSWFNRLLSE